MNRNARSSFDNAMSVLSKSKNLGMQIRFALHRGPIGMFSLDGKVEEVTEKRFMFRGVGCVALLDWETCPLSEVEDLSIPESEFSFNLRFVLDADNFFMVTGLDRMPSEVVN
jgi:hypothetical protein